MLEKFNKILCLAPHPDDIELGCGGTVSKLIELGKEIHYCIFSLCEKSIPEGYEKDNAKKELGASCDILGINKNNVHFYYFEVREYREIDN